MVVRYQGMEPGTSARVGGGIQHQSRLATSVEEHGGGRPEASVRGKDGADRTRQVGTDFKRRLKVFQCPPCPVRLVVGIQRNTDHLELTWAMQFLPGVDERLM